MQLITLISSLLLLLNSGHSFSLVSSLHRVPSSPLGNSYSSPRCNTVAFSSPDDEAAAREEVSEGSANESAVTTKTVVTEPESNDYPIDLPSPLLLSASMVLAITSTGKFYLEYFLFHCFICPLCLCICSKPKLSIPTGSLFELTSGTPTLGFGPQAALAAIGLPSSLFLIYAAIKKGEAETEEDDRQYNKPRSF